MGKEREFDSDVCNKVYKFLDVFDSYFYKIETEYEIDTNHIMTKMLKQHLD